MPSRFLLESKARPRVRGGRKVRTWDDDWPEFLERLKALIKRFKVTIKTSKQRRVEELRACAQRGDPAARYAGKP